MLEHRGVVARGLLLATVVAASLSGCGSDPGQDGTQGDTDSAGAATAGSTGSAGSGSGGTGGAESGGPGGGTASGQGNGGSTAGANAPDLSESDTLVRADTLELLEPDLITKPFGIEGPAITAGAQSAVDDALVQDNEPDDGDGLPNDGDGDGYVDLSLIVRFLGAVDPTAEGGGATLGGALCPYPYDVSQVCGPYALGPWQDALTYENATDCVLDGTDKVAAGSCFFTKKGPVTVNVQLVGAVPLQDAQVVGSWANGGADGISAGWVRGFLPESVAKTTKLPPKVPLAALALGITGGTPLIDFLSNRDKSTSDGTPGWWFVMSYSAKPVLYDPSVGPDAQ